MADNTDYKTVEEIADEQKLIKCYQIQVDDNGECKPVYLGLYPEIPLPVNKIIQRKKYNLHVVTYVLTEEEINKGLYKIVGVNVFRRGRKDSLYSLDLIFEPNIRQYQLIFNDHRKQTTAVVENVEKFPGKDNVLEYIILKSFEEPLKSKLTSQHK